MGITASENFSSKFVNFAVSKSVRRGLKVVMQGGTKTSLI